MAESADHLAAGGGGAAIDGGDAGFGAQVGDEEIHLWLVAAAVQRRHRSPQRNRVRGPLPIAAMTGDADHPFAGPQILEAFERSRARTRLGVEVRKPQHLG